MKINCETPSKQHKSNDTKKSRRDAKHNMFFVYETCLAEEVFISIVTYAYITMASALARN